MCPTSNAVVARPGCRPASMLNSILFLSVWLCPFPGERSSVALAAVTSCTPNSTLALNAETGEIQWYFQYIPAGNWDQDHPFERLVVETEVTPDVDAVSWMNPNIASSERRKVITGIPGKPGIVWTLDAATGDFLWATQTNYQNIIVGVDVEGRKGITNPEIDITEIGQQKLVCPTTQGGINWNSVGYSPQTNSLYTPTNNTCMNFALRPVEPTVGLHHASARSSVDIGPEDTGQVGQFASIDVATGETRWTYKQRAGIGGSVLTTGGGLVFVSDDARRFSCLRCRQRRHSLGTGSQLDSWRLSGEL